MVVPAMQLASKIPDMSVQLWSTMLLKGMIRNQVVFEIWPWPAQWLRGWKRAFVLILVYSQFMFINTCCPVLTNRILRFINGIVCCPLV